MAVVGRILQYLENTVLNGTQQSLSDRVGECHTVITTEIALHSVHHNIGSSCCRLVWRQCVCAFRIHNGELTTTQVVVEASLVLVFVASNHATVTHLTTSSGNGKDCSYWQTILWHRLTVPEVPRVTVVRNSVGYGFCRVYNTTTTYGKDEVYLLLTTQRYAILYQR